MCKHKNNIYQQGTFCKFIPYKFAKSILLIYIHIDKLKIIMYIPAIIVFTFL